MRFLCCGPMLGVECWGDWRPSGTPSLGLRCTGVPFGVGDLLIFYCFAVGVLQPGVDLSASSGACLLSGCGTPTARSRPQNKGVNCNKSVCTGSFVRLILGLD